MSDTSLLPIVSLAAVPVITTLAAERAAGPAVPMTEMVASFNGDAPPSSVPGTTILSAILSPDAVSELYPEPTVVMATVYVPEPELMIVKIAVFPPVSEVSTVPPTPA